MIKSNSNTAQVENFNFLATYKDRMNFLNAVHVDLFGAPEPIVSAEDKTVSNGKYQERVFGFGTI